MMGAMTDNEPTTIPELIGGSVNWLRTTHRIPREDIAAEMRRHGFKWSANRVTDLEAGRKSVGVKELVGLAHTLSRLSPWDIRISDLMRTKSHWEADLAGVDEPDEERLELAEGTTVPIQTFAGYFRGEPVDLDLGAATQGGGSRFYALFNEDPDRYNRLLGDNKDLDIFGTMDEPGEPERALAHKLNVLSEEVLAASIGLWGRMLTQEREARLGGDGIPEAATPEERERQARSLQARRGRVTLALQKEVRERLEAEAEARGELPDPPKSDKESQEWPTSRSGKTGSTLSGGKTRSGVKGASSSRSSGMPARSKRR